MEGLEGREGGEKEGRVGGRKIEGEETYFRGLRSETQFKSPRFLILLSVFPNLRGIFFSA